MRTRPTRPGSSIERSIPSPSARLFSARRPGLAVLASLAAAAAHLGAAMPAAAETESAAETATRVVATGVDATIVRPLAALRAGVGSVLLVPAAILASPACLVNLINSESCRPVYEAPYEVLVSEPADYAFNRKLGEL